MSHQSRQTSIQNSHQTLLMGYSTDPRNPMKSACYEKKLNFWQIVCATLSLCRVLPGARETRSPRSEEHTSELQSHHDLVCRLLLEKKKKKKEKQSPNK